MPPCSSFLGILAASAGASDPPPMPSAISPSLYGLHQAPHQWFLHFVAYVTSLGFIQSHTDTSLFVLCHGTEAAYLLLYVDNMILYASSSKLLQQIIFLGIDVRHHTNGFFLSQEKYTKEVLERAGMSNCKSVGTLADVWLKTSASEGALISDASWYCSMASALQWPDIAYVVQQVCFHIHAPRDAHLALLKRILRYVNGTTTLGLHLHHATVLQLMVYIDADWASCPDTWRSTSGFVIFLDESLVSWSPKQQTAGTEIAHNTRT
jgi:hypothetical protein